MEESAEELAKRDKIILISTPVRAILEPSARFIVGIRNKNPLNIRGNDAWLGSLGHDAHGHHVFDDELFSVRAWAKTISNYWNNDARSLLKICEIYAPREDGNDPVAYAKWLSARLGTYTGTRDITTALPMLFSPKNSIAHPSLLRALCRAMAEMEIFRGYVLAPDKLDSGLAHYELSFATKD